MTDTKNTVSDDVLEEYAILGMSIPRTLGGDVLIPAQIVQSMSRELQSLRAFSSSEELRRRAAGPSEVKWPMPDPLAKYKDAALRSSIPGGVGVQCCMCGKTGLSTIEGDGGTECQLEDGRWTCSEPCWEKAGGYGPDLSPAEGEPVAWNDAPTAPKDGTVLRLLVVPDEDAHTSFHDSGTPYETIGFNNLSDTGDDEWHFAGWDWSHDCITQGHGEVIGWLPFHAAPSNPVTSDEMVERVLAWVREDVLPAYGIAHDTRASDPEMIEGLSAALSVKPQSGEK